MGRATGQHGQHFALRSQSSRAELIDSYQADHRLYEQTAELAAVEGWVAVRLDGVSFHSFTRDYVKPFDGRIEQAMDAACEALMTRVTDAVCAYTQSDEITLVIKPETDWQGRRLEKTVSVCASIASVAFSTTVGATALFDARLLQLPSEEDVLAMLAERQQDAIKNAVSVVAFWALREQGLNARSAERQLSQHGGLRARMQLLDELGLPFNDIPPHRRRGRLLTRQTVERDGFNPITNETVTTIRRVLQWDLDMPDFRYVESLPGYTTPAEND